MSESKLQEHFGLRARRSRHGDHDRPHRRDRDLKAPSGLDLLLDVRERSGLCRALEERT
jgi:hypothetical protein